MNCPVCGIEYDFTGSPYTRIEMEGDKIVFAECVHGKSFGVNVLDRWLRETAKDAPPIEDIWKITKKLPSLTRLLLEDRQQKWESK